MKRNRLKKREPIERVYKEGREAIVKSARKKPSKLASPRSHIIERHRDIPALSQISTAPALDTTIHEKPSQISPIKIDEYGLPSYNTTRLVLIAKDPFWIYAYWDIASRDVDRIRGELGGSLEGSKVVMRMYDVTCIDFNGTNANHWFDIEVGNANSWYINLWHDNASYCADLGIRTNSGRFFPMARSNFVHTPRLTSSNRFEEIWMDLKHEPLEPEPVSKDTKVSDIKISRYPIVSKKKKLYLSEADLRRYYSRLSPLLRGLMFSRISKRRIYRQLYSMPDKEWQDMLYMRRLGLDRFGRRIMLGASEFMFIGASENLPQGASEFVQPGKKRKFFFEIDAEVIVYGRTEHDADVRLGDKKVSLRPDGTFSMRFSLPDGKIPLPFTATSADKAETRKITTNVERETKQSSY